MGQSNVVFRATTELFFKELVKYVRNDVQTSEGAGPLFLTSALVSSEGELSVNPLKPELNPICYLLALLGAHHFLHVSRIRVKLLTLR